MTKFREVIYKDKNTIPLLEKNITNLINEGNNVNELDEKDASPLYYATRMAKNSSKIIKLLVDNGANVDIGKNEQTPLDNLVQHAAINCKYTDSKEALGNIIFLINNGVKIDPSLFESHLYSYQLGHYGGKEIEEIIKSCMIINSLFVKDGVDKLHQDLKGYVHKENTINISEDKSITFSFKDLQSYFSSLLLKNVKQSLKQDSNAFSNLFNTISNNIDKCNLISNLKLNDIFKNFTKTHNIINDDTSKIPTLFAFTSKKLSQYDEKSRIEIMKHLYENALPVYESTRFYLDQKINETESLALSGESN